MRLVRLIVLLCVVATSCAQRVTPGAEGTAAAAAPVVEGTAAAPGRVPDTGPLHETPEGAALASAENDIGRADPDVRAEVIFRHPQVETDVRVKTSGPDYCVVWSPVFDDRRDGWVSFGSGRDC